MDIEISIEIATLEAIYWWNRSEGYYHKSFKNIDLIYENKNQLRFFKNKIFEVFLREYSVRRNLSSGRDSIDKFIELLFNVKKGNESIFALIKKGEILVIDYFSNYILENKITLGTYIDKKGNKKTKYLSNNKRTISLLSKIASLINPNIFYLYDTLAKKSIINVLKELNINERRSNNSYKNYHQNLELLKNHFSNNELINSSVLILKKFQNSDAYNYFSISSNTNAFNNRVIDKFLWLKERNNNRTQNNLITNESYFQFYSNFIS